MDKQTVLNIILGNNYYTIKDLRFNKNIGYLFNNEELNSFLEIKEELLDENNDCMLKLPLKTFNSKHIFYTKGHYIYSLIKDFLSIIDQDLSENYSPLMLRNYNDITASRIFSEIEGTLSIENVPTTHKRVKEIFETKEIKDKNDIIVKNMFLAMDFINNKPQFNKENLFKLYQILSKDCLDEEDLLPPHSYYRNDSVKIGDFNGAPYEQIEEMMNSLFKFVNGIDKNNPIYFLLPHICHYYLLYVHPYFDYNGRTARMVSYWISKNYGIAIFPSFMSEAINENKKEYYRAIVDTRMTNNDLTYFLGYIFHTSINFYLIYKNIEHIDKILAKEGNFLNKSEKMYVKKILLHNSKDYFTYKMFNEYINNNISKQRSLTILNDMVNENLLVKETNKKGNIIFKFNQDLLKYNIN